MKSKNILILGARAPMALELARSFNNQGLSVILADSFILPVSRWSNSTAKYVVLPSARFKTTQYIQALIRIVKEYSISDLIPCCEEVFYIAKYKTSLPCKVWTSNISLLDQLHNKETFAKQFKSQLKIPKTIPLKEFLDWTNSDNYVFKQKYSRFAGEVVIGELTSKERFKEPEKWIAQKRILGTEICVYSVWDNGNMKGFVCYQPVFRAGKGAGIFFKFIENKDIEEKVKQFGEEMNYTGQLCFDVILSTEGSFFIECNPRGTSGAHLLGKHLANCFFSDKRALCSDEQDSMLASLMTFSHPFMFLKKEVRRAKAVLFRWSDPLPAILQWLSLVEIVFVKLKNRVSWLKSTTYDIEWNGDEDSLGK